MMRNDDRRVLSMWIVFDHPLDFPDCYVMRRHDIVPGNAEPVITPYIMRHVRYEVLYRELDAYGFFCLGRYEDDDPCIAESWI